MKTYLITGAYGGIGSSIVKMLSTQNVRMILIGRNEQKLKDLIHMLNAESKCICICCDLNNLQTIHAIFDQLEHNDIKLDGLIYAAGIAPLMRINENDTEVMTETFNVNLLSFIEMMKYFSLESISSDGSSVVAISSIVANMASYRQTVYGATKAGLNEAVRCIAKELVNRKIRVNTIMPGLVETEMVTQLRQKSENFDSKMKIKYPLGIIQPYYIARMVDYLLSDDAMYITGQSLPLDGGGCL